jgi:hypothetical protein
MNPKGERLAGYLLSRYDTLVVVLSISLAFFLGGACSKEEQQEVKSPKVIVRKGIPPQKRSLAPKRTETEPEKKATQVTETRLLEEKRPGQPPQPIEPQRELVETKKPDKKAPEVTERATLEIQEPGPPPRPEPLEELKAENVPEEMAPEETKIASREEEAPSPPPLPAEEQEEPREVKAEDGHYTVRKGDSLFSIAGREDVYGDPLKWPSLFRLNMEHLDQLKVRKGFKTEDLPEGLDLRFFTAHEVEENLARLGPKFWVANVLSSRTPERILPPALKLMKNGYQVYIKKVEVKGEAWLRLRVGFFEDNSEAAAAGQKIMSLLNSPRPWIAKVGQEELEEFGGY